MEVNQVMEVKMKAWVKAGLIVGMIGILLTILDFLIFFLPLLTGFLVNFCSGMLFLVLYPGVGLLVAYYSKPPRTSKRGAIDGALAGLLAFSLNGVTTVLLMLIALWTGIFQRYLDTVIARIGLVPVQFSMSNPWVFGIIFLVLIVLMMPSILYGVFFGGLGGLAFANLKRE
jgi:hypothetical protein